MTTALPVRALLLLLLVVSLVAPPAAQASMYNNKLPGAWPGGHIAWYYNPANRPANVTDDEIIASVTAAFAAWKQVCQVDGSYMGLTNVAVSPLPKNIYVVGWTDFGSDQFTAKGLHAGSASNGSYVAFTDGAIQLNTASANFRPRLDGVLGNDLVGTLQHEIGHTLGLAHSDDPASIMFANPYNSPSYTTTIQGDDIAACAEVYGGRGLVVQEDKRGAAITSPYAASLQGFVHATQPTIMAPASSLAQIDATSGAAYYFSAYWQNLPLGTPVYRRWIAPSGTWYEYSTPANVSLASGYNYSSFPANYYFPFAGQWAVQVVVGGQVATNVPFTVTHGQVDPVPPFEAALLGERNAASGQLAWRAVPYGRGSPTATQVLVSNGQGSTALTAPTLAGTNTVALWMETDRVRYKPDQDDGQPLHSYDALRQLTFSTTGANGAIAAAPTVTLSGATPSASISAQFSMPAAHDYNIYAVMLYNGQLLWRGPSGWTTQFGAVLTTAHGPAVASVDLLRNYDIRALPAGLTLWVGWGQDLLDMLNNGQFALARQF
jgi:hypothetical protein